jgi:hypothetical protein
MDWENVGTSEKCEEGKAFGLKDVPPVFCKCHLGPSVGVLASE